MEEKKQAQDILLKINNFRLHYNTREEVYEAVNGVSFNLKKGTTLGLVGETGAGKTSIALAIMGLLPIPPARIIEGEILFNGEDLLKKDAKEMRRIRGNRISMIFQDPMTALNPVLRVGDQIMEVIKLHDKISKAEAEVKAHEVLQMVGIEDDRFNDYPHQFSGGMKQRVVIAMALVCRPELIIADEPTTALDVTIQAQVLSMMKSLRDEIRTSMLLITHDLGIVAENCDECAIIYAGEIMERGTIRDIFGNPLHPYTLGLFNSIPSLDKEVERLTPIPGLASDPTNLPEYCSFCDRCPMHIEKCRQVDPETVEVSPGHFVKCHLVSEGSASAER
ncbi:MAG: ABC transporter ATP-binding protein [Parasporobacterium sp.]|nr:ABC transporter ATP-binding protein [Parasporobacterium sp.]